MNKQLIQYLIILQYSKQMGSFLSSIEHKGPIPSKNNDLFFDKSIQQIYEYHGLFKSICQDFGITKHQFLEIFGNDEEFNNWESQKTGKVNGLEIFSSLILLAQDCVFKEKIKFLFNIYDFNDIRSISPTDLEFMLVQICNSVYRLYRLNSRVNNYEVADLVAHHFDLTKRINITGMLSFCINTPQIKSFMRFIGLSSKELQDLAVKVNKKNQGKFAQILYHKEEKENKKFVDQQQISRYADLLKKMLPNEDRTQKLVTCKQSWVYGIKTDDIQTPFILLKSQILYVVSSVAVLYNPCLNQQKLYTEHQSEIIAICYSSIKDIAITSQKGSNPCIYFWRPSSLSTIHKLITPHQNGIHLLSLMNNDAKLVTVGLRVATSIIVYSVDTYQKLQSFYLPELLIQIVSTTNLVQEIEGHHYVLNSFFGCSSKSIFYCDCSTQQVGTLSIPIKKQRKVSSICCAYLNLENPYLSTYVRQNTANFIGLVGYQTGQLSMITLKNSKQSLRDIFSLKGTVSNIQITNQVFIVSASNSIYLFKLTCLTQQIAPFKVIAIDEIGSYKLLSNNIRYFQINDREMLVMTNEGEIIEIKQQNWIIDEESLSKRWEARKLCSFLKLKSKTSSLSIVEQKIAYVTSHNNRVISIDLTTHSILQVWSVPETITAMDVISFQEGIIVYAIGKQPGTIMLRIGGEEHPRTFYCGAEIIDIKIASDYSYLSLCTKDSHIFVFSNTSNNLLSQAPKKLKFQNQRPLSINFSDDNKSFFVCTNIRNVYQFYLPDLKNKNVFKDNDKIYLSYWNLTYCYNPYNQEQENLPALLGSNQKPFILTTPTGELRYYQNMKQLLVNSYSKAKTHLGPISKIIMCPQKQKFYTLGVRDNALIQWKVSSIGSEIQSNSSQLSSIKTPQILQEDSIQISYSRYDELCKRIQKDAFILFRGVSKNVISQFYGRTKQFFTPNDRTYSNLMIKPKHIYGVCSSKSKNCYFDPKNPLLIIYFTSRFICSINFQTQEEQITSCTRMKISCITVNQQGIIAAGQASQNPQIYIVNDKKLVTTHKQGIIHLTFFKNYIYSFGIYDSIYSINIHDYKKGNLIKERFVQQKIQSFLVLNDRQFLSFPEIKIWKDMHPSEKLGYATASCIIQASSNVCISTKSRDICIMKQKQIIKVKQNAHSKEINILMSMNYKKGVLISGGKDEIIKIWGINFQELCVLQLKSCRAITRLSTASIIPDSFQKELLINNIDSMQDQVLVSLTNGQILLFTNIFDYVVSASILIQHASHRRHQYQHQVHIDIHPKYPFMVSIGDDNYLSIKDYVRKNILVHQYFPFRPTAVKFSPNDKLLVLGFENGELLIFTIIIDNQRIILSQIQKFQDLKSSILAIEISECCSYIAVSFLPCFENEDEPQGSKVLVYKNKDSDTFDNHYYKFWEIGQQKVQGYNLTSKLPNCACFLTFFKQKGNTSVLIYYQKVNQYALRIGRDPNGQFKLFDIQQKTVKKEEEMKIDWNMVKFPSYVNCAQINQGFQNPMMTAMVFCKDNIIYGSANGDIYIVKKPSLYPFEGDNSKISEMCMARTYPCLTSFISQLLISPDGKYLFCVSVTDETIVQYQISTEATVSSICNSADDNKQSLSKEEFYNYLNTVVPLRDQIGQFLVDIESPLTPSPVFIQKKVILGRRAYDRKNNLIFDGMGNLLYHVGTNIILQSTTTNKQKYIAVNPHQQSSTYQISCIAFNLKKGLLAVSTEQFKSTIFIWNIHAKICISQFQVNCSIVNNMCFSEDGQCLILNGLHKKYYSVCILIQLESCKVLGTISYVHQNYWFLKSLCFKKNKNHQFITGGVEHLKLWTYQAQMLTFESFQMQLLSATFMTLVDTENYLITGCQFGNLYIWNKLIMIYNIKVHDNCIQTMMLLNNNLIVTGCVKGQVALTKVELEEYLILQKWNISELLSKEKVENQNEEMKEIESFNIKYSIQSLTADNNTIYVGTKCGSIYSINIDHKAINKVSICHDNEKPVSCCFDENNKLFMYITDSGYLEVWKIEPLKLILSYEFQKKTKKIIHYNQGLLVIFQRTIGYFELNSHILGLKDQYRIGPENYVIADCLLNGAKTHLFVAVTDRQKTDIISYKLPQLSQLFKTLTVNMQLEYLDISLDDHYLLLKDRFEDIGIIQIVEFRRMNTIFIEFSLTWRSHGIRLNQDALNIHSCYNKQNPIAQILYLTDNHLLVGDQLGTLRIFDYPVQDKKLGQLHLACYTDHLNVINGLEISSNKKWVISMSQMDRSLILWEVKSR